MKKLKNLTFAAITCCVLLLASCTPAPVVEPTPVADNCSLSLAKSGVNEAIKVEYDGQHRPTKITVRSITTGAFYYTVALSYNSDGKISNALNYDAAGIAGESTLYVYDSNKRLVADETRNAAGVLVHKTTYTYDASARRNQVTYFDAASSGLYQRGYSTYEYSGTDSRPFRDNYFAVGSGSNHTSSYVYDANGNITEVSNYYIQASGNHLNSRYTRTFDAKKAAKIAFSGLADAIHYTGTGSPNGISGNNNILSETETQYDAPGGTLVTVKSYNYEYNDKGFPTKRTSNSGEVLLFDYNCH